MSKLQKNKKLLILCPYPENNVPAQRLKYEQYFDSWRENGFEITIKSFVSDKFMEIIFKPGNFHLKFFYTIMGYLRRTALLFSIRKYDVVYTFLWITPFGPPLFERFYILLSKKFIYDIDDLVFLKHKSKANKYIAFLKGKTKSIFLMKKADHVITCTPYLDNFVRKYNQNTTDISSTVDTENRYIPTNQYNNDDQIVIGWSGSHSTSKYLYLLKDVLVELSKEVSFKLIVMGDKTFQIDGVLIEALDWSDAIEISTLQRFDIGLYPLPDEEWVYGKSGLKAIQYMALGIPTVATEIGTIHRIIEDNENGFLVHQNDSEIWKQRILTLINSPETRKLFGTKARQKIVSEYSITANKARYLTILNSCFQRE